MEPLEYQNTSSLPGDSSSAFLKNDLSLQYAV